MQPFREVFWNIGYHYIFYSVAAAATVVCIYGLYLRWRLWRSGWPERRDGGFDPKLVLQRVFLNSSIFKGDPLGGFTHVCIMWGFLILFIGTALSTIDHWIVPYLTGDLYLVYAFVLDVAGSALMLGVVLAYLRRYVIKREKMVTVPRDHVVLVLLFFIALTGFMVEGFRLRAQTLSWSEPSPVGRWIADVSGLSVPAALAAHRFWWWVHAAASMILIAYFPFSKFIHVFAASVNVTLEGMHFNSYLSLEEREALKSDFSFRHHVMFDACTQCNRCTVQCPSAIAKEALSPRKAIAEAGCFVRRKNGFGLLPRRAADASLAKATAVRDDSVWLCTTCGRCRDECPSAISPLDVIREVRTARIEGGEDVPVNVQEMLESVYKFKNPWQGAKGKRMEWASGLDVPVLSEGAKESRCFYVGCTFAYDSRLQSVPRAAVNIFRAAGFGFAVLGKDEACCSEFIRGVGEDGLFTELAAGNADAFDRHGIREIVTPCPHGFHTFRNEYARMRSSMKERSVLHVSQALERIIASGALALEGRGERTVTFHDPCFLGRRNGVYDAPRNVLKSIPGVRLVEMARSREKSLCCGGGGGRMWVEAGEGEKIAEIRVREAAGTGAGTIVTACPFCFSNMDDAVKTAGFEGRIVVKDLTELVAESLPGAAPAGKGVS
jgi:Fe-S oxidoreductase/nitrate reductase gamma subunit